MKKATKLVLLLFSIVLLPIVSNKCNSKYRSCCNRPCARPKVYSYGPYPMLNWDPYFFTGYPYLYPYSYYYPTPGFAFGYTVGL